MFGFVIGVVCLIAFFTLLRRRRWGRFGGYGHHCGHWGGRFGHGHGRGAFLYRAFEQLETTPGQEKAIRAALTELRTAFAELRPELANARTELAQTVGAEPFDTAAFEATLERKAASLGRLAPLASRALGQIHEALDSDQRRRLARWIESGPGYFAI